MISRLAEPPLRDDLAAESALLDCIDAERTAFRLDRWMERRLVTDKPANSERHRGGAQNGSLMRFLSKQDQVMACSTTKLKAIRQRNMNGLFNVFLNRCHTRQRACNGNMLKEPAVIFSVQNI